MSIDGTADTRTLGRAIKENKRVIFACIASSLLLAICLNAILPPVYQASVRLEIRGRSERVPIAGGSASGGFQSDNVAMYTAAEKVTHRALLAKVASDLWRRGWNEDLEQAGDNWQILVSRIGNLGAAPSGASMSAPIVVAQEPDPRQLDAVIERLRSVVKISPIKDTRLVDVNVEMANPFLAQAVANRLTELFAQEQNARAITADINLLDFLNSQVRVPEPSFGRTSASGYTYDIRSARQAANEVAMIDARLERLTRASAESTQDYSGLDDSGAIESMRRELVSREMNLASVRQTYKDKHPKVAALKSEVDALRGQMRSERARIIASMRAERNVLASLASRDLATAAREARRLDQAAQPPSQNTASSSKESNASVAAATDDPAASGLALAKMGVSPVVEIIEEAVVANAPVRPRKGLNLAIAFLVGSLMGTGLALSRHALHGKIRVPEDVAEQLDVPLLGVLPVRSELAS